MKKVDQFIRLWNRGIDFINITFFFTEGGLKDEGEDKIY